MGASTSSIDDQRRRERERSRSRNRQSGNGQGLYFGNTVVRPGTRLPPGSLEALLIAQMRPDLAYAHPDLINRMINPPPPPPQVQHTNTVRSDLNLRKDTLKLVRVPGDLSKYVLEFTFDASVTGAIHVFYNSQETSDQSGLPIFAPLSQPAPSPVPFSKELNQKFTQSDDQCLDISKFKTEDLVYRPQHPTIFPIVIVLLANIGPGILYVERDVERDGCSEVSLEFRANNQLSVGPDESDGVQAQITFCTGVLGKEETWELKVIKQKIIVNGRAYVLQEIYGIDSSQDNIGAGESSEGGGGSGSASKDHLGLGIDGVDVSECVVCLTEPRDTTVLPCRHMCLCHECAELLRHKSNKCPVCRGNVDSFLQIKVDKSANAFSHSAGNDKSGSGVVLGAEKPFGDAIPKVKT